MSKTTADLLVERLIAWEVDKTIGFLVDGINGIFKSLRQERKQRP